MSVDKYFQSCPDCDSLDVAMEESTNFVEAELDLVTFKYVCRNCGETWDDEFDG